MKNLSVIFLVFIFALLTGISFATPVDPQAKAFKVEVKGQNKAGNILFIPGLGCPGKVWDKTVAVFEKEYACHVFTLAGFAGQPALKEATLATIKDQVIAYIENKKLKNVTLIGHSLGGFMSYWIAAERPELIKKMVSVDGLPYLGAMQNPYATAESMRPMAKKIKEGMLKQRSEEAAKKSQLRTLKSMITAKADIDRVLKWNLESDQGAVAQAMYDMYTVDLREKVANIKASTLVMGVWWGKEFGAPLEAIQQTYQGQIKKIPNHKLLIHKKAKHFIMYDDFAWFKQQLTDFLKQ